MTITKKFLSLDWVLTTVVLLLIGLSLASLYPISYSGNDLGNGEINNFFRQVIFAVSGMVIFFVLSFVDYRFLRSVSPALFLFGIFLLIMVVISGKIIRGTSGWITLGFFNFQPVELFKLIIAVTLARYFSLNIRTIREARHIFISAVPVLISIGLILAQPDLGSAIVIFGAWAGVLLLSGTKKSYIAVIIMAGLLISLVGWHVFLKDYQKERIIVFMKPSSDPLGAGYNVLQSTVAVGSGGIWGKGLGHGSQSQLNFLPEKHTDFIFAVISEELGFVGAIFVLILMMVILIRLFSISNHSRDNFGKLLVGAISVIIFIQIIINIGMNIGIVPVAGIPLPLLSYGGSSLLTTLAMLGIAQSVFRENQPRFY